MTDDPQPLRCLRIDLTFDGTDFCGWQRQPEQRSVQGRVEAALEEILGAPHSVVGSGRTDAGVHARQLVASTRTEHAMPARRLLRALDAVLPPDVGVLAVEDADPTFHARRDAVWKWYRYSILLSSERRPLLRRTTWRVADARRLDAEILDAGAAALRGRHDFAAFASTGSPRRTTVRTLFAARWEREGDLLHLDLVGDGFLYKMVRTAVGTLVGLARPFGGGAESPGPSAGRGGAWPPSLRPMTPLAAGGEVGRILGSGDRACAGPVAPARGLCLMAVGLRGDDLAGALPFPLHRDVESAMRSPANGGGP